MTALAVVEDTEVLEDRARLRDARPPGGPGGPMEEVDVRPQRFSILRRAEPIDDGRWTPAFASPNVDDVDRIPRSVYSGADNSPGSDRQPNRVGDERSRARRVDRPADDHGEGVKKRNTLFPESGGGSVVRTGSRQDCPGSVPGNGNGNGTSPLRPESLRHLS